MVHNPSHAWAAGALISDLDDQERFFRALLGGRLLPPRLLAEMTTPVDTGVPGFGYGLGLVVIQAPLIQAPSGRLIGHDGGIPGFLNIVLSTQDGRRLVVMLNELFAPPAVVEAYLQAWTAIATQILGGAAVDAPTAEVWREATNHRIAPNNNGHCRPLICPAHQAHPPPAAGSRNPPRISDTEEDTGSGLIGLAVPDRPIGPWSRRTGAPEASATGRDRALGPQWVRGALGPQGRERSPTGTTGDEEPQVTGPPS